MLFHASGEKSELVCATQKHTRVTGEPDRERGDRPDLNNKKKRPAVEKSPERRKSFAKIDVLTACLWHHRRQFSVRQCGRQREQSGHDPNDEQPTRRTDLSSDDRRNDENS